MAARYELEARITSATDLKNVNWRNGKLEPYAVVWVEPQTKCATYADVSGGASHRWDQNLFIPFGAPILESTLHIDIMHAKSTVGSAEVSLGNSSFGHRYKRTLQLERPSGRPQGKLVVEFSVRELAGSRKESGVARTYTGAFGGRYYDDDNDNGYSCFGYDGNDDDLAYCG